MFASTVEETPPEDEENLWAETAPARAFEVEVLAFCPAADFVLLEVELVAVEALFDEEAALPEKVL